MARGPDEPGNAAALPLVPARAQKTKLLVCVCIYIYIYIIYHIKLTELRSVDASFREGRSHGRMPCMRVCVGVDMCVRVCIHIRTHTTMNEIK